MVDNIEVLERKRQNSQRLRSDPEYRKREAAYAKKRNQTIRAKRLRTRNQQTYDFKRKFGITVHDKDAIFIAQGCKCAICGSETSKSNRDFALDHDHKTGKIRGVLCHQCNVGLGNFEDSLSFLQKAINYLKLHTELNKEEN